jgi:hypothetical protein
MHNGNLPSFQPPIYHLYTQIHQGLILHPRCAPEKVSIHQKWYSHHKQEVKVTKRNQPKVIKSKMRQHKLRSCVNRWEALTQEGIKQTGVKCSLHILYIMNSFDSHSGGDWLDLNRFRDCPSKDTPYIISSSRTIPSQCHSFSHKHIAAHSIHFIIRCSL